MSDKVVRDPIHGYITLTEQDRKFIDTPYFQRLRRIRQSGCYTVYPSANHTRFEHSMGVMHLGSRVMETVLAKSDDKVARDLARYIPTVRYACLLHDLGHAPLSHIGELFFDQDGLRKRLETLMKMELRKGEPHEYMSCIVALEVFRGELEKAGVDLELFCRMITGNKHESLDNRNGLIEILNSSADADRLDYFPRDSFSAGTGGTLVSIDTERLLRAYRIAGGRLCLDKSALSVVANFVYARNTLFMWVYQHHVCLYTDYLQWRMIQDITKRHRSVRDKLFTVRAIMGNLADDFDVFGLFKRFSEANKVLYDQFFGRRYYKPLWKSQFQLRNMFSGKDAELNTFIEMKPSSVESDIRQRLGLPEDRVIVLRAEYDFRTPDLFIHFNGTTERFASLYRSHIYADLFDTIPMIYIHPDVDVELVKKALRDLYFVSR